MNSQHQFPLTSTAGRVALLVGITAGTVTDEEIQRAVIQDTAPRPYRKPVVVEDIRFDSVTDAAKWLNRNKRADGRELQNLMKKISRWCNADNIVGYYWAE